MNSAARHRLLLVEDDARLAALTADFLIKNDLDVAIVGRGDEAIAAIRDAPPDLVVLDLNLPGGSGFDVCRAVRQDFSGLILMLTARDDDVDQIVGLEMGADDYVIKPVEPRLLLARVRALLRRPAQHVDADENATLEFAGLRVCARAREVTLDGRAVDLTTSEFDLLWLLTSQAGTIIDRTTLFEQLRGLPYDGLDRSVDIGVSRLRRKLHDTDTPPRRIKTVRGRGYLFVAAD